MITHTVEISRPPKEVFDYLDQLPRHTEWQGSLVDVKVQGGGPTAVGTRVTETRKGPGGGQYTYEITEYDPPWRVAFKGLDGAIRPSGKVRILPLDGLTRSRVQLELELEAHTGMGKFMLPFARWGAQKQIPKDHAKLKELLEAGA
jgi:uncharacterized membrane protein